MCVSDSLRAFRVIVQWCVCVLSPQRRVSVRPCTLPPSPPPFPSPFVSRLLHTQGPGRGPVTFLGFADREFAADPVRGVKAGRVLSLYVTTRSDVVSYFTGSRKQVTVPPDGRVVLSGSGCDFHCCTIVDDASQSLVVGNEDGVFFFSPEVRVPAFTRSFSLSIIFFLSLSTVSPLSFATSFPLPPFPPSALPSLPGGCGGLAYVRAHLCMVMFERVRQGVRVCTVYAHVRAAHACPTAPGSAP
jgi:hypothetical protein